MLFDRLYTALPDQLALDGMEHPTVVLKLTELGASDAKMGRSS